MLDAGPSVKIDIFFYLRLPLSVCRFIYGHFDDIVR
jgi:hypothetical protein